MYVQICVFMLNYKHVEKSACCNQVCSKKVYVDLCYVQLLVCWILLCWIICMLNSSMLKNVQVEPPVQVEPNPSHTCILVNPKCLWNMVRIFWEIVFHCYNFTLLKKILMKHIVHESLYPLAVKRHRIATSTLSSHG